MAASVRLHWIPVGAGRRVVRGSTRILENLDARRHHRPQATLYHSALEVRLDADRWTVEMAPAWGGPGHDRGVTTTGPVGLRRLGASPLSRYEVRVWRDGTVPDLAYAVGEAVRVSTDPVHVRRLLDAGSRVPALTWGRDELGLGDMWNSNSVVAWMLATSGHLVDTIAPPGGGRAPGWAAGLELARRSGQTGRSTPASSSTPSTSRGPGRAHIPSASTACTRTPLGSIPVMASAWAWAPARS